MNVRAFRKIFLILLACYFLSITEALANYDQYVSFDLDETLISSDKLLNKDLEKAQELGYQVQRSVNGQYYIIRPGVEEVLDFAKSQGFKLMIFTHNLKDYADDILESSGLADYFTQVITHEDTTKPYNVNFQLYPNHRNRTYNKGSIVDSFKGLYKGFLVRGFQKMQGNSNIEPYLPCNNCAKYPPIYNARVHFDNSKRHIDDPIDYVGIKVKPFYGLEPQAKDSNGNYLWAKSIKQDLNYLKHHGWVNLYRYKFNKMPDTTPIETQLE